VPTRSNEAKLRARRPLDTSLNTEKTCRVLGIEMPGVETGLRRFRALYDDGYPQQLTSYLTGVP
jgi:hypothetical protein